MNPIPWNALKSSVTMIECGLCFHHCKLEEGQTGFCRARKNVQGKIISLNQARYSSIALDPIEKKPLLYFYPGSMILSLGSAGCNLRCPFCQNYSISMAKPEDLRMKELSPKEAVDLALSLKPQGNIGIAFTYNEPLINFETVLETCRLAKAADLKTVLVTNGTIEPTYLETLLPYIDALNIDLKGFTQSFYTQLFGNLESVKKTIAMSAKVSHVEITTLIIPGKNDNDEDMAAEAQWLASIDPDLPLHITRFFPRYLWDDLKPTPVETLMRLKTVAKQYLHRVHIGNV